MTGRRSVGRAVVLASASALLTTAGHLAGGGRLPELGLYVVLVPLLAGACVSVARRCPGFGGTVGVLALGQFALHHLMVLLHPTHGADPAGPAAVPDGVTMLAMHAAITVVTAVALTGADRALAAAADAVGRVLRSPTAPLPADRPLRVLVGPGPSVYLRLARLAASAHVRRGPPVGA